ncbi:hypothetical protein PFICI_14293 [Pestalotiopsis fici W106-1]|uniref:Heterokaryon incompatibility domain-containing protein n=1 Tax=Pestalotiopsis fici (strain W106-1 / CGMCC3.15140) TaxID=1229662 RepID=W3WMP5_PESFW|nr:uncharacterized protein PFICI_14293 [Pestalotiopsis fici W106-1]ETS74427.1 hypothetical protein PFICI_14293 [Pestalotiopsis fici W106-1]
MSKSQLSRAWHARHTHGQNSKPVEPIFLTSILRGSPHYQPYEHQPLDTASFRILQLLPADRFEDDLECEIQCVRLPESSAQKVAYTALSYVWGQEPVSCAVVVQGKHILIQPNLESALRHLRRRSGTFPLWIDALCIDQSNTRERNHQVQHMRDIYEAAEETIVYLGDQDGGNTGISAWNYLGRNSPWALDETGQKSFDFPSKLNDLTNFRGGIQDIYSDILPRVWFSRVWEHYLPSWYKEASEGATTNLLDMLVGHTRGLVASDPRDKVIGLLGICSGFDWQSHNTVDYNLTTRQFYTKFAADFLRAKQDFRIFSYRNSTPFYSWIIRLQQKFNELDTRYVVVGKELAAMEAKNPAQLAQSTLPREKECLLGLATTLRSNYGDLFDQFKFEDAKKQMTTPSWVPNWQNVSPDQFYEARPIIEAEVALEFFSPSQTQPSMSPEAKLLSSYADLLDANAHREIDPRIPSNKIFKLAGFWKAFGAPMVLEQWHFLQQRNNRLAYHLNSQLSFKNYIDLADNPLKPGSIEYHLVESIPDMMFPNAEQRGKNITIFQDRTIGMYRSASPGEFFGTPSPSYSAKSPSSISGDSELTKKKAIPNLLHRVKGKAREYREHARQKSHAKQDKLAAANMEWTPLIPDGIALFPLEVEFGDLIVYFPGATVPFVVRPLKDSSKEGGANPAASPAWLKFGHDIKEYVHCELVGECWINDFPRMEQEIDNLDCLFHIY